MKPMKYLIPLLALLMISAGSTPRIVFEKTDFDFGEVEANSEVNHVFIFHNKGTGILNIKDIKAG